MADFHTDRSRHRNPRDTHDVRFRVAPPTSRRPAPRGGGADPARGCPRPRAARVGPARERAISGGVVVLPGKVPGFYLEQLAQATVLAVPGVEVLRNVLRVNAPGQP